MTQYVNRVVTIGYEPESISFKTDEEYDEFVKALGYIVMYAMRSDRPRDVELVGLNIAKDREMTAAYYDPWQRGEGYENNKPQYKLDEALSFFHRDTRPFVMGGIPREPRDEGEKFHYSFHS